jgi:hypothetical protein
MYVDKMINPTSRGLQLNRYMYCLIDAYPTELPGLNEAIGEVRDTYNIWLISNSLPDPRLQWLREVCSKRYKVIYRKRGRYGLTEVGSSSFGPWQLGKREAQLKHKADVLYVLYENEESPPP